MKSDLSFRGYFIAESLNHKKKYSFALPLSSCWCVVCGISPGSMFPGLNLAAVLKCTLVVVIHEGGGVLDSA